MTTKTKPSGIVTVTIDTKHGKRTISTGVTNKKVAEKVIKQAKVKDLEMAGKVGKLQRNVIQQIISGKKISIEKAIDEWAEWMVRTGRAPRTIETQAYHVKLWAREADVETLPPSAITEEHIHKWTNDKKSDRKLNTRVNQLSAIRSFFEYCTAKGYALGNPAQLARVSMNVMTHSQKETEERKPFTESEFKRLMTYIKKELTAAEEAGPEKRANQLRFWFIACPLSRYTGMRLGDICQLEWDCFSKPGFIAVWTDKRDVRVQVPLSPEIADAVACIPIEDKIYCFPEERQCATGPLRARLSVYFGRLCENAEVKGHSFHDLRHTYVTDRHKKGTPLGQIAKDVGHRSEKTTKGYVHE